MNDRRLLRTGIIGSVICGLGCVTPLFVIAFSALGLSAVTGYLDYVLFPGLALFLGVTAYAFYKLSRRPAAPETPTDKSKAAS